MVLNNVILQSQPSLSLLIKLKFAKPVKGVLANAETAISFYLALQLN
jgi:hypothetical protein